jgi:hypothetical protein
MITMRRRPAYSRMHPSTISPVSYHKLHWNRHRRTRMMHSCRDFSIRTCRWRNCVKCIWNHCLP